MKTPEIYFWPPYTHAKTRSTDGEPRVRHEGQISTRWYRKIAKEEGLTGVTSALEALPAAIVSNTNKIWTGCAYPCEE